MNDRSRALPAEQRRAATVQTVVDLAGEQNPAQITTTAIADRMGLTQGALFRHFPTKDSILEAAMSWISEHLLAKVDSAIEGAASPVEALEAVFMAHIRFVTRHSGVPRLLFGELQRPGKTLTKHLVQTLLTQYEQRLRKLLERGKIQRELSATLDVDAAAVLFIGMIQGLVIQSLLTDKPGLLRKDAAAVFTIYRRSIGAP